MIGINEHVVHVEFTVAFTSNSLRLLSQISTRNQLRVRGLNAKIVDILNTHLSHLKHYMLQNIRNLFFGLIMSIQYLQCRKNSSVLKHAIVLCSIMHVLCIIDI